MSREKRKELLQKYKYPLLFCLLGVCLLAFPKTKSVQEEPGENTALFSLDRTQAQLEELLSHTAGVGRVSVMLTLKSGSTLQLAEDSSATEKDTETRKDREILTVNRGSGYQEVIVTREMYPVYLGAVVVCEGAENSKVRLSVIETVSVLTGLSSDHISVVKWQP